MASQELEYLAELMVEFPVQGGITYPEAAQDLLQFRFQLLLDSEKLFNILQNTPNVADFPAFFE